LISEKQLDEALKAQVIYGGRLGTNLVELGFLDEEALAYFLSEKLDVPYAHPKKLLDIEKKVIDLIPYELVEKYKVLPFELKRKRLRVIMPDPQNLDLINELSFITGFIIEPMVTTEARLLEALEKHYGIPRGKRFQSAMEALGVNVQEGSAPSLPTAPNKQAQANTAAADEMSEEKIQEKLAKLKEKRRAMLIDEAQSAANPPPVAESLQVATQNLKQAPDRDAIANALIDFVISKFPRAAILVVKKDRAEGWKEAGTGFNDQFVQRIKIPLGVPGILKEAGEKGFALHDKSDEYPIDKMLRKLLRVEESLDIAVTGIYYRKAVVCYLVAVVPEGSIDEKTKEEFIRVAKMAGKAFDRLIKVKRKKERNP